jgi:hypothetical protein
MSPHSAQPVFPVQSHLQLPLSSHVAALVGKTGLEVDNWLKILNVDSELWVTAKQGYYL